MSLSNTVKLVATDLDGTLLQDDKSISEADIATLNFLGEKKIVRVAATGRNMHKVFEVLPEETPFDYIVFSSGAGVYDWKEKKLLVSEHFETKISQAICHFLIGRKLNFFAFLPIPENNLFQYYRGAGACDDFDDYLSRHIGSYSMLNEENIPVQTGQFMAIISNDGELFESIKSELEQECSGIRVIRTTSPVDTRYLWLEVFPDSVSKGHGLKWLCDYLKIPYDQTVGIGNDFNDQDMFDFVKQPYLLGNSPAALISLFPSVSETNDQSGFSKVIGLLGI
ncbi:MAG TPA: HAD family hydrolase [Prolixibacteraceae bacterium]|nr:HAD family hydrolase [Prolixibacteraceae bacterium]HPS13267.1 HAD family hydrolase [Prolixibacteraceae bacterium]